MSKGLFPRLGVDASRTGARVARSCAMSSYHYTVVCETASPEIAEAFEAWLVEGHAMDVVEAGALEAEVLRRDDGLTLECRYLFPSREAFIVYERDHAPRLRAEGLARFPGGMHFSRSTATSRATARIGGLRVETVPYFADNYAYLLHTFHPGARGRRACVVVDPGDATPVLASLEVHQLAPVAIWCTHHHPDHVGGLPELLREIGEVPVLGSRHDLDAKRIPHQSRGLSDGETLDVFGTEFRIVAVPGHTLGAIAYVGAGMAFTGDTLFLGGCGRVFEGTMEMMHGSLARLGALDPETRLFVGHEYTEANLRFAAHVEPTSDAVRERLERVRSVRAAGRPTVPGTVGEERATNPFLRSHVEEVVAFARGRGPVSGEVGVFAQVREAKNAF